MVKDITQIDKNFAQNDNVDKKNTIFYNVLEKPFSIYGVSYDSENERFCRFPFEIAKTVNTKDDNIEILSYHTSGGRIRFATNSKKITVMVRFKYLTRMSHMTLLGSSGVTICENTDKGEKLVCSIRPNFNVETGYVSVNDLTTRKSKRLRNYTLYFPLYNGVNEIILGFDKDAEVAEGLAYKKIAPVLYYGSSITQGGCASRPDLSYQAIIAKENNVDFINMGFSGGAKGEPNMVKYLSTVNCSVFVLDYDHNAYPMSMLEDTHYNFYKKFRTANKHAPIIFVSRPGYKQNKEGNPRFQIIKNTYDRAIAEGDTKVYLVDGRKLFGKEYELCTVDRCHPNDLGFYKMAQGIGKAVNKALKENNLI